MRGATVKLIRAVNDGRKSRPTKRRWNQISQERRAQARAWARRVGRFKDGKWRRPDRAVCRLLDCSVKGLDRFRGQQVYQLARDATDYPMRKDPIWLAVRGLGPNWKAESEVVDDIEEAIP